MTALLAAVLLLPADRPVGERPNIVYIMADELGYYELGHMGNENLQTPRIDRLAAAGMRFTQCLAGSSCCAPTRCTLMTGKHGGHASVRANDGGTPLRADEPTIASMLKSHGYATGGFGKWGCGGRASTGVPEKHGFDTFLGYYDQVHAHTYYPRYLIRNSEEVPLAGNVGLSEGDTYSHYVIVDEAKAFIRDHADEPFLCYLPVTPPHGIFDIPDSDPAWDLYKDKPWPEQARRYAAMISMVDRQVGEVVDLLDELDLTDNTLVVFCGDNGGNDYFPDKDHPRGFFAPNRNPATGAEFRGTKNSLYEGGLRIPFLAQWPGRIEAGAVSDHLCYFPDMMATFADLTGAQPPADTDGVSFAPTLLGTGDQKQHEYLYWELNGQRAVRMDDWKAVRLRGQKQPWKLYNLSEDIDESDDMFADHPDVLARMKDYADEAHEPVRPGVFLDPDRTLHEQDRLAKFGTKLRKGEKAIEYVHTLPEEEAIPQDGWKVARVSSENAGNRRLARMAIDGRPLTHWHTNFSPVPDQPPHDLVIDLGQSRTVTGLRYLSRQDVGWNGTISEATVSVGDDSESFRDGAKVTFEKDKRAQQATFRPQTGRYVRIRVLKEINGGPWASAAEFGLIGQ